ncbi:hypothetical protein R6Q57_014815, partial [Mikania cordata]
MKESPERYINPFLSDEENDKANFTTNPDAGKFEKSLEPFSVPPEPLDSGYIDKNVTECQLPEMIACYEEAGFNVVKDICVDEGLSNGEIIKCDKEHHELSCNPITINGDKNDHIIYDMIKDDVDTQLICSLEDKIKLSVEPNVVNSSENCCPDNVMPNGGEKLDLSSGSPDNSNRVVEPTINGVDDVDQPLSETQSTRTEPNEPRQTNDIIDTPNEIMEGSTILNSDNVKPTASCSHEPPENTQSALNHHEMASSNFTAVARGGGESSFSMAGPVSGLITYLGPITASGSLSHRSDGSNSSVRSFAFPILQNEWNSSP